MKIGVVKERAPNERRGALRPGALKGLSGAGGEVLVQQGGGDAAVLPDGLYFAPRPPTGTRPELYREHRAASATVEPEHKTTGAVAEALWGPVLFSAEAVAALLAALMVAIYANRASYLAAFAVAASAVAVLLVSRYVDLGAIGPFPDLYDPVWFGEKVLAAAAEAGAALAALAGLLL